MYNYVVFGAGFVAVLLVSIGCNICISNYRNSTIRQQVTQQTHEIKNSNSDDENIQESVSMGQLSNKSSKYETIDENDMAKRNSTTHKHNQQRHCSSLFDQSYLDVIADDVYSASNPQNIDSCLLDVSSTSNLKKETTVVRPTAIYTDDQEASRSIFVTKRNEEAEISTASNSSIHLKICSVVNLLEREANLKERNYMNTYLTLNTCDMDYCQSFSTPVAPDSKFESVIKQEKQCVVQKKRHSCP